MVLQATKAFAKIALNIVYKITSLKLVFFMHKCVVDDEFIKIYRDDFLVLKTSNYFTLFYDDLQDWNLIQVDVVAYEPYANSIQMAYLGRIRYDDFNDTISFLSDNFSLNFEMLDYDYTDGIAHFRAIPGSYPISDDEIFRLISSHIYIYTGADNFTSDLYPELIDNSETKSNLSLYVNGGDISSITDKDIAMQKLLEQYNNNVLLLRSQRKVKIDNEISVNQMGEGSVDLSATNQALTNIANKLVYDDKNLVQSIQDLDLNNMTVVEAVEKAPYNPYITEFDD